MLNITNHSVQFSSVAQLCPTLCDPMNHRPPCPSPTPTVHSNSCPSSQWCHPAISSSVVPFSSCLQSLPASESFPMSQLFASGGQSIGVSALASVLPKKSQDWSPLGWTGLDLLAVQGTLKSLLQHHSSKASILQHSAFFTVQLSHPYMTTGKTTAMTRQTFVGNVMSLLFNMLSRLVITFLPRSKRLLISWLQSPSAVILYIFTHNHISEQLEEISPSILTMCLNLLSTHLSTYGPSTLRSILISAHKPALHLVPDAKECVGLFHKHVQSHGTHESWAHAHPAFWGLHLWCCHTDLSRVLWHLQGLICAAGGSP